MSFSKRNIWIQFSENTSSTRKKELRYKKKNTEAKKCQVKRKNLLYIYLFLVFLICFKNLSFDKKTETQTKMVIHNIDMNMQYLAEKKLTVCLILLFLELFIDGKLKTSVRWSKYEWNITLSSNSCFCLSDEMHCGCWSIVVVANINRIAPLKSRLHWKPF